MARHDLLGAISKPPVDPDDLAGGILQRECPAAFPDRPSDAETSKPGIADMQFLGQLDESLRKAILGNVGTIAAFPVGPEDAVHLENQFFPPFTRNDLVDRPKYGIYVRLAIDGKSSRPFSATTHARFGRFVRRGTAMAVRDHSRNCWAEARQAVQRYILGRTG